VFAHRFREFRVLLLFMLSATDIAVDQDEGLKLLFQRGLELALQIQDDAMGAGTTEERAKLGSAFHRLSRGVRQTAALRMRLAREAERSGREAAAEVAAEELSLAKARTEARKDQVKSAVERLIWTEAEPDERDDFMEVLGERLDALDIADPDEALGDLIPRIAKDIGLQGPPLLGEGDREAVEGASAVESQPPVLSGSPLSRCATAPPSGGAIGADDDLLSDDYWRSSG
jgi:hypothetical protein